MIGNMAEGMGESMEEALWDSEGLSRSTTPRSAADESVMEGGMVRVPSAMLQSTPLAERPPSLTSLLSSVIKPSKEEAMKMQALNDPNETICGRRSLSGPVREYECRESPADGGPLKPPRRSLLNRLSSIAERSFNSTPRKMIRDRIDQGRQERRQQMEPPRANQDKISDGEQGSDTTLTEGHKDDGDENDPGNEEGEAEDFNNNTCHAGEFYPAAPASGPAADEVCVGGSELRVQVNHDKRMPSKDSCTCQSCKAIIAQDSSIDLPSEVSCSLASLETGCKTHNVDSAHRNSFCHDEENDYDQMFLECGPVLHSPTTQAFEGHLSQTSLHLHRNAKLNDGVRRIGKFLRSTFAAGRRSNAASDRISVTSEVSASPSSKRSFWTSKRSAVTPQITGTTNVPQLLKCAGRISISNDDYGLRPGYCDTPPSFLLPEKDSDAVNASINSIMIVLIPPGSAEPNDTDSRLWMSDTEGNDEGGDSQRQLVVRDPLLKDLLEELKQVMADQEMILKQSSKALDKCGRLMGHVNANQGIVLAEQMLHVALQRYFAAEGELQWYIDGGEFEPQRDNIVIRELKIRLREEFRANVAASKDQFVFLVLLKVGHRVEASDVLWMTPEDREIVVKGRWSHGIFKGPGGKPNFRLGTNSSKTTKSTTKAKRRSFNLWNTEETPGVQKHKETPTPPEAAEDFEFNFNRSDWKVDIEIYSFFLKRPKWESSLTLNKIARKLEQVRTSSSPSTRRKNSRGDCDRHIEVRKSSFGLLARATLSKDDVLARRPVTVVGCLNPSPFESELKIVGEAHLSDGVHYTAMLNVKDYTGSFGRQGGMRAFVGKLCNTVLSFFESCPTKQDEIKPVRIFDLSSVTEDCIEMDTIEGLFFHGFTLWLRSENSTTGSAESTPQAVDVSDEVAILCEDVSPSHPQGGTCGQTSWSTSMLTPADAAAPESTTSVIPEDNTRMPSAGRLQQDTEDCLRLCTNSREQTLLWVEHLRRALRQARVVELV